MREAIVDELKAYEPELIEIRRDIHRHPETGFEETRTAKVVADHLRSWGIDVVEGVAKDRGRRHAARQAPRPAGDRAASRPRRAEHQRDHGARLPIDRSRQDARLRARRPHHDAARRGAVSRPKSGLRRTRAFHLPARRGRFGRGQGDGRGRLVRTFSRRCGLRHAQRAGASGRKLRDPQRPVHGGQRQLGRDVPRHRRPWRGGGASSDRSDDRAGAVHHGPADHRQPQRPGDRDRGDQRRLRRRRRHRLAQHHSFRGGRQRHRSILQTRYSRLAAKTADGSSRMRPPARMGAPPWSTTTGAIPRS